MDESLARLVQLQEYDLIVREQRILNPRGEPSKDLSAMLDRIAALRGQLPADVLGRYDRFVQGDKIAVVKAVGGQCQGCFFKLPTGLAAQAKANAAFVNCPNCGRFLYC